MGLTRSAALDYAKQGIRINAVNLGYIVTEITNRVTNG
ncbi:MAG: SDR family oxidoreductase [Nostoc sp. DedSLP03]|nr:SDR family oxidoreductase [Nostoc sp. DedSLP03]MDZ7966707.1 SDR family oxidoreductase [Nostoc sp. DedSLP03]